MQLDSLECWCFPVSRDFVALWQWDTFGGIFPVMSFPSVPLGTHGACVFAVALSTHESPSKGKLLRG